MRHKFTRKASILALALLAILASAALAPTASAAEELSEGCQLLNERAALRCAGGPSR